MLEKWETIQVYDRPMRAFVVTPDGAGPFPAVVLIQARHGGVGTFIQDISKRLASEGYFTIAPELFHIRKPGEKIVSPPFKDNGVLTDGLLDTEIITEVNAAVDFLVKNKAVNRDRVGILGFQLGGRIAWIMPCVNSAANGSSNDR